VRKPAGVRLSIAASGCISVTMGELYHSPGIA
jgi:hypothetical protein